LTTTHIDEREVLDNMHGLLSGLLIGDKELLSKTKQAGLGEAGINAADDSPRTTKLYDRRAEEISLDEVEQR
jgi:hypothetical protein